MNEVEGAKAPRKPKGGWRGPLTLLAVLVLQIAFAAAVVCSPPTR